jgi:hypothetical protein
MQQLGKVGGLAVVIAIGIGASTTARATLTWASPLQLNSPNVVGTVKGLAGDNPGNDEIYFAQELLNLPANTVNFSYTDTSSGVAHNYNTSSTEYSGTLTLGNQVDNGSVNVSSGWQYAIAKYDGQNAGYVLFYLGGQDAVLPATSYDIWVNDQNQGYGISGFTTFNAVPEPSTLIAGALLLLPFGFSTFQFFRKKRVA